MTVHTHCGLYCYKRLPFDIAAAPAIFQRTMECLIQSIPRVCLYIGDVLVTGATEQDHLANMTEVLRRLSDAGID